MLMTMMILAAAGAASPAGAPVQTNDPQDIQAWVEKVNKQLDKRLRMPAPEDHGMAVLTFRRGEDGRPVDVTVRSGKRAVARAARMTIQRVRELPPLPASAPSNQLVTMNFLVGNPAWPSAYAKKRDDLYATAQRSNIQYAQRLAAAPQVASLQTR